MNMRRVIPLLAVLLVAQVLLALLLWRGGPEPSATPTALLAFDPAAVDRIEIDDGDKSLALRLTDTGWVLPGLYDFPAATGAVAGLIGDLAGLRPGLAVAASAGAAQRFRVAEDGYERRIRLLAGDKVLATLYLGDAAGPRRAYGRADGDEAIHALEFTALQAAPDNDAWVDRTVLQQPVADIAALRIGDIRLQRDGAGWRLADLAPGEATDQQAAAALVQRIAGLGFMGVAGRAEPPPAGDTLLTAEVELIDGRTLDYRFIDPGRQGDPLLLVSGLDHALRIGSHVFGPIRDTGRAELLQAEEPPAEPPAGDRAQ